MVLAQQFKDLAQELSAKLAIMEFPEPVAYVYDSFDYAFSGYAAYVEKFVQSPKRVFLLGMNPGPWGMAQTGIPFGEISAVRDWMGLRARFSVLILSIPSGLSRVSIVRDLKYRGVACGGFFQSGSEGLVTFLKNILWPTIAR